MKWLLILSLGGIAAYWFRWAMFLLDDSPEHPADSVTTNVVTLSEYREKFPRHGLVEKR
jgi:hypothetical protein